MALATSTVGNLWKEGKGKEGGGGGKEKETYRKSTRKVKKEVKEK
jgi:hypothetical protein